jgi:DMSO/TMAO reductase YedYZ molybdopterin-dependent catalytic subunit
MAPIRTDDESLATGRPRPATVDDPAEDRLDGGLAVVEEDPFNAEAPLAALLEPLTPVPSFYVRSNFRIPDIDVSTWRLRIEGWIDRPMELTLGELQALGAAELTTVLECAGNGRRLMVPVPDGTPWGLGAVGSARFTGVPLRTVLDACGVRESALEVVFEGADAGEVEPGRRVRFERSLPIERALDPGTLLAWAMNGEPLTPRHGYPVRLVVPRYYAVASVKWLQTIRVVDRPFSGHFQAERYVYRGHPGYADETPVTLMHVRALIATPAEGDVITGACTIRGAAWSGHGRIVSVQVSADGGSTWGDAVLQPPALPHGPTLFEHAWIPVRAGVAELIVRAEDSTGARQPLEPVWNELGYANNVVHRVRVNVSDSALR